MGLQFVPFQPSRRKATRPHIRRNARTTIFAKPTIICYNKIMDKKPFPTEQDAIKEVILGSSDPLNHPVDSTKTKKVSSTGAGSTTLDLTSSDLNAGDKKALRSASTSIKPEKQPKSHRATSLVIFLIGLAVLVIGVIILVLNITARPAVPDADYLVDRSIWTLSDAPQVEWTFTEVGKGTLTTNSHTNDYNFLWSISGDKLTIETDWLYTLDDTYTYKLDQSTSTLTLTTDDGATSYIFTALRS